MDVRIEIDQDKLRGIQEAIDAMGPGVISRIIEQTKGMRRPTIGELALRDGWQPEPQVDVMRHTRDVVRNHGVISE